MYPLTMNDSQLCREGSQRRIQAASRSANARILLVEDDDDLSDSVSRILREAGYRVSAANNGVSAFLAMDELLPDLILSDINMPGLDGLGLLHRVRSHPLMASTPVIFLTALADARHQREAMNLGADDFLNKPVERQALLQAIESRLRRSQDYRDQCQARLRRQKEFVSLVAHDLRAPISVFRLGLDMVATGCREVNPIPFEAMENAFQSMNGMVDRLMVMARYQGDSIPFEPKMVNLEALCDRAATLVREHRSPQHALDIRIPAEATIHIDPVIGEQVLSNLLSNAFKYSPQGGLVTLVVTLSEKEARFEVTDQGTGMSSEELAKVFDSFYRSPRHRHIAGNGLGLFGSKLLVERHGGRIECRSVLGVGTRFIVTLPIEQPADPSCNRT